MSENNKCNDDKLYQIMKDISINRKKEIEEDTKHSKSICELVDVSRDSFITLMKESITTNSGTIKRKDIALILHLLYLKLSDELLQGSEEYDAMKQMYNGSKDTEYDKYMYR